MMVLFKEQATSLSDKNNTFRIISQMLLQIRFSTFSLIKREKLQVTVFQKYIYTGSLKS